MLLSHGIAAKISIKQLNKTFKRRESSGDHLPFLIHPLTALTALSIRSDIKMDPKPEDDDTETMDSQPTAKALHRKPYPD